MHLPKLLCKVLQMITKKDFVLNILKTLRNIHSTTMKVASIHYIFPAEYSKINEVHMPWYYTTVSWLTSHTVFLPCYICKYLDYCTAQLFEFFSLSNNNVRYKSSLHIKAVLVAGHFPCFFSFDFIKGENTYHTIKANNICHISFPLSQLVRCTAALF